MCKSAGALRVSADVKSRSRRHSRARARKISITVDEVVLAEARRVARQTGRTLSAHITEAVARDLRRGALARLLADYETGHGEITEQELAEARQRWQG